MKYYKDMAFIGIRSAPGQRHNPFDASVSAQPFRLEFSWGNASTQSCTEIFTEVLQPYSLEWEQSTLQPSVHNPVVAYSMPTPTVEVDIRRSLPRFQGYNEIHRGLKKLPSKFILHRSYSVNTSLMDY